MGFFSEIYHNETKERQTSQNDRWTATRKTSGKGFFDGRFVQRVEESKKVFKRKEKHINYANL